MPKTVEEIKLEREVEETRRVRAALRQKYGPLYDRIAAILFQADPVSINLGFNTDEYESETYTILSRLGSASTLQDVEAIVYEEFCQWFSVENAGPREKYQFVAARTWKAWREFNQRKV